MNANPDIAPDAGLARMARVAGIEYPALIRNICELALARAATAAAADEWVLAQKLSGVESAAPGRTDLFAVARGVRCTVKLGALQRGHRNRIREILDATSVFRDEEVAVALELFDETFAAGPARAPYDPGDGVANYEFVGSFSRDGQLVGYVCYGATPGTDRVYDLYWIAMHPEFQGEGGGSQLLDEVERRFANARRGCSSSRRRRATTTRRRATFTRARGYDAPRQTRGLLRARRRTG